MADQKHSSRLKSYKNAGANSTDLRRKRAALNVALRKQSRDVQLLKRRALSPLADEESSDEYVYSIAEIIVGIECDDLTIAIAAAKAGRQLLSQERNPPIAALVEAGIIKPLVEALKRHDCSDLQFEAAWALTNIASGSHEDTMAVVDGGAIGPLVTLARCVGVVAEQAVWALGNIAGNGPPARDAVLNHGALDAILPYLQKITPTTQLRTNVWTYSNMCRNKNPMVKFELVSPALPLIAELLDMKDQEVLTDACWALSYLTDGPNERIEAVQNVPRLTERLILLLEHSSPAVKTPALRTLGNMLTGTDIQTDRCTEAGCLDKIIALLHSEKPALVKEASWAASNILAGTHEQIQQALDKNILEPLLQVLQNGDIKSQKEVAWAVNNLCLGGSAEQLDLLLSAGVLEPYCVLLSYPDHKIVILILDGLFNLLQAAAKHGKIYDLCLKIEEIGVLDKIEALQQHENEQIYNKSIQLIDTYFSGVDENSAPAQDENEFYFGNENNPNIQF